MNEISISTVILAGTVCLFVGMHLGKQSLRDNIQALQEAKQECWGQFESAANGNVGASKAFSELESWLDFKIETEERIQEAGYYQSQQRY